MKKKYIICSAKFSKSNGVRVLYKLQEELQARGYDAYMFAPGSYCDDKHKYISDITEEMRKNDIVIYPEIVFGNPLKFQNVVRWILYYPGKLGGDNKYADYEQVFTFNKTYAKQYDVLGMDTLDKNLFYYDGTVKDIDCYFVYKGGKWKEIEEFNSMTEINMKFPEKREDLANLLRRTKTLYSYDRNTLLLDEAIKCGCEVKIVEENGFSDYKGDKYDKFCALFNEQITNFIDKTQKMNYKGKIQKGKISFIMIKYLKYFIYKYILHNKIEEDKYKYKLW